MERATGAGETTKHTPKAADHDDDDGGYGSLTLLMDSFATRDLPSGEARLPPGFDGSDEWRGPFPMDEKPGWSYWTHIWRADA